MDYRDNKIKDLETKIEDLKSKLKDAEELIQDILTGDSNLKQWNLRAMMWLKKK